MNYIRVSVIIHGYVQGVAFRANTQSMANRLQVKGWVKNNADGTVHAVFEGEKQAVDNMLAWCRRGPIGAQVHNVEIVPQSYTGEFKDFEISYDW
ncbi:MAG: acylphosphatase [Nitrospirota bacterium]